VLELDATIVMVTIIVLILDLTLVFDMSYTGFLRTLVVAATALAFSSSNAFSFCSEPSFSASSPDAPGTYQKPDLPYCLSSYRYSRTHTCEKWEIDSYFNEVNEYIEKLNSFVEEANDFAQEAIEFANDASTFARCQADDVKSQTE
jgi:hypothetical protein